MAAWKSCSSDRLTLYLERNRTNEVGRLNHHRAVSKVLKQVYEEKWRGASAHRKHNNILPAY